MRNYWLRMLPRKRNRQLRYPCGVIPAAIEKEVLIDAPVEVVWRVVTEPEQIRQWFSEEAEIELRVGGKGRLKFKSGIQYFVQVEVMEPPHRFAFRWVHPEGSPAREDNSMLVEFTLAAEGGGTRLRVVESGFDKIDWSDAEKARYADDHSRGWSRFAEQLRDYVSRTR